MKWTPGENKAGGFAKCFAEKVHARIRDLAELLSGLPKARGEARAVGAPIPAWTLQRYGEGYGEKDLERLLGLEMKRQEPEAALEGIETMALYAGTISSDGSMSELGFYNKGG